MLQRAERPPIPNRLFALEISNFKGIAEASLHPDGKSMTLRGPNGSGKTSIIDALWWLLKGLATDIVKPLRNGTERVFVKGQIGQFVITRSMNAGKKPTLKIESVDGKVKKYANQQDMLDDLLGRHMWEPIGFAMLGVNAAGRQAQADQLRRIVPGLDFTALDAEHDRLYAARTAVGQVRDALRGQLEGIAVPEAPAEVGEERDPKELRAAIKAAEATVKAHGERREAAAKNQAALAKRRVDADGLATQIEHARGPALDEARRTTKENAEVRGHLKVQSAHVAAKAERVREMERALAEERAELRTAEDAEAKLHRTVAALVDPNLAELEAAPQRMAAELEKDRAEIERIARALDAEAQALETLVDPDVAALEKLLDEVDEHNRAVRDRQRLAAEVAQAQKARSAKAAEVNAKVDEYDGLTAKLDGIKAEKAQRLAAAQFPVDGLTISDGVVTFDDGTRGPVPLYDCNTATQIRVGMALVVAERRGIEFLVIRRGESLDRKSWALIDQLAAEHDVQVIAEMRTEDEQLVVVIEERVVEEAAPAQASLAIASAPDEEPSLDL